jgi:ribosomal-protein-alanine N-acetyltransferase
VLRAADLRTDRLRLREITEVDVEAVVALSCDPRVNRHSPTGAPTLQQATGNARGFVEDWRRDGIGYWVVERGGRMIGIAGIKSATLDGEACWNLYYRFAPAAWGQGLAREAAVAALHVAGRLDPKRPVVVRTRPTNGAAARLARAVGMVRAPALDSHGFITFVNEGGQPDS